ncbi:phage tail length tape measure family protein [Sphingomonas panni]|uniref:phage tail length tape measure family protein n=1 Tax=Sphingomonas panni TaxID=237612 RepID=UPI001F5B5138|nr:phage tail length tape measure family protein [Sphingomonas panni]
MTLKTSLVISSDSSGAVAAIDKMGDSLDSTAKSADHAGTGLAQMMQAAVKSSHSIGTEMNNLVRSTGQVKAGYQQLGFQMQDIGIQLSMGTDLMRVMAMQGGSLASALDMIGVKGAGGRLASFFAGPWGAVILTAGAVLGPMISQLWATDDAAKNAAESAEGLAKYVDNLGNFFDKTTGKIKETNRQLVLFAALSAAKRADAARDTLKEANEGIRETITSSARSRMGGGSGLYVPGSQSGNQLIPGSTALIDIGRSNVDMDRKLLELATSKSQDAKAAARLIELRAQGAKALKDIEQAEAERRSFISGQLDPSLRPPGPSSRRRSGSSAPSFAARDEFGRDTADKLGSIVSEFSGAPDIIGKTNEKVRELDDMIDDLSRRKPPNFAALIQMAEGAKVAVRNGLIGTMDDAFERPKTLADRAGEALSDLDAVIDDLSKRQPVDWEKSVAAANNAKGIISDALNRPLEEFLRQADDASRVTGLMIQGRQQEAEVTRIVLQMERERGALSEAQVDQVRAAVAARQDEAAALERAQRSQAIYLDTARDIRSTIDDATQAWVRGDLRSLLDTPAKLVDSFNQSRGRELFNGLFGDSFADLERALTEGPAEKAARSMANELDGAGYAASDMASALDRAAPAIDAFVRGITAAPSANPADSAEITVTGRRRDMPRMSTEQLFTDALTKASSNVAGLFTSRDNAGRIGAIIGEKATTAIKGAADGAAVAGVAGFLGIKMSGGGSQVGGALGALTGLPGGSIVGSILGGLAGNLLTGPTRSGYASLGTDGGGSAITAISGGKNSDGRRTEAVGYANSVMDRLGQIAGSLGGTLASNLNLGTIGSQGDKYVFDRDGAGAAEGIKVDSLQEAVAEALRNAVVNGAVTGVSEAVKRALGSGKDIERALSEAGSVRQLEASLGGIVGAIKSQFGDLNSVAAERVRLAKAYGLDLLAVERKNAEDRTKLAEQLVKAQVGSLQSLIAQMTTGDLAEGSAMDKIAAQDEAITKAKADLAAGVDGAGDLLARLYQDRLSTAKDAYGTTGQYAIDRDRVLSEARDAIKMATSRVDAGRATDPALATTNAQIAAGNQLADEGNDILSEMRASIHELVDLNRAKPSAEYDFSAVARLARV